MSVETYKGWYAKLYKDTVEVADCRNVSFEVNRNTEVYQRIGVATPLDHAVGTYEITGSMEVTWYDNSYVQLIQDTNGKLTEFELKVQIGDVATSGKPVITLSGVVLKSVSMDITPDDPLTQKVEFVAKSISLSTL